jgi:hypothetical protein
MTVLVEGVVSGHPILTDASVVWTAQDPVRFLREFVVLILEHETPTTQAPTIFLQESAAARMLQHEAATSQERQLVSDTHVDCLLELAISTDVERMTCDCLWRRVGWIGHNV